MTEQKTPPAADRLAQTVTDAEAYACRLCGNVWTGQLPDNGRLPLHMLRCSCNPNSWAQFIKLRRPLPDFFLRARESAPAHELDIATRAAFFGWQHASWEWNLIAGAMAEAADDFSCLPAAPRAGE